MFKFFKKKNKKTQYTIKNDIGENIILGDKKLFQVDVNDNGRLYTVIRVGDNLDQMQVRMSRDYKFKGYSFNITEIKYPEGYVVKIFAREGIQYKS